MTCEKQETKGTDNKKTSNKSCCDDTTLLTILFTLGFVVVGGFINKILNENPTIKAAAKIVAKLVTSSWTAWMIGIIGLLNTFTVAYYYFMQALYSSPLQWLISMMRRGLGLPNPNPRTYGSGTTGTTGSTEIILNNDGSTNTNTKIRISDAGDIQEVRPKQEQQQQQQQKAQPANNPENVLRDQKGDVIDPQKKNREAQMKNNNSNVKTFDNFKGGQDKKEENKSFMGRGLSLGSLRTTLLGYKLDAVYPIPINHLDILREDMNKRAMAEEKEKQQVILANELLMEKYNTAQTDQPQLFTFFSEDYVQFPQNSNTNETVENIEDLNDVKLLPITRPTIYLNTLNHQNRLTSEEYNKLLEDMFDIVDDTYLNDIDRGYRHTFNTYIQNGDLYNAYGSLRVNYQIIKTIITKRLKQLRSNTKGESILTQILNNKKFQSYINNRIQSQIDNLENAILLLNNYLKHIKKNLEEFREALVNTEVIYQNNLNIMRKLYQLIKNNNQHVEFLDISFSAIEEFIHLNFENAKYINDKNFIKLKEKYLLLVNYTRDIHLVYIQLINSSTKQFINENQLNLMLDSLEKYISLGDQLKILLGKNKARGLKYETYILLLDNELQKNIRVVLNQLRDPFFYDTIKVFNTVIDLIDGNEFTQEEILGLFKFML